ncbi:MAG: hypothetical protein AB4058_19240 [Microcystaceae cyanobacterium]
MMISSSTYPIPPRKHTLVSSESVEHHAGDDKETKVSSPSVEEEEVPSDLPQPDSDNITVLTDKLPNKPILPWNRYDSPWEETEEDSQEENSPDSEEKE